MKGLKLSLVIMAAALLTIGLGGMAYAFHDGGVAYCDGCHTMHNSTGGTKMTKGGSATPGQGNNYLLQGSDQSSTCLNCHASGSAGSYHVAMNPVPASMTTVNYTPGGDFAWLQKSYSWTLPRAGSSAGERHGHNIIAADFGYVVDGTLTTAPGASATAYSAGNLGCQSCHDPHGRYRITSATPTGSVLPTIGGTATLPISGSGSYGALPTATEAVGVYRLLGGVGYFPKSYNSVPFVNDVPIAVAPSTVAPSTYNQSERTNEVRVAYGQGMSEWCQNCHGKFHADGLGATLIHPAGNGAKLTADVISNYNAYKMSGDLSGAVATSYTSMVPFEEGTNDLATLALHASSTGGYKLGADTNSNVQCLTCHRAHATAWDSISRWNNKSEFLTLAGSWPGTNAPTTEGQTGTYATGKTMLEYQAAMYDRLPTTYATYQRSLCNKCHAKD